MVFGSEFHKEILVYFRQDKIIGLGKIKLSFLTDVSQAHVISSILSNFSITGQGAHSMSYFKFLILRCLLFLTVTYFGGVLSLWRLSVP